jgi:hypothetical protein
MKFKPGVVRLQSLSSIKTGKLKKKPLPKLRSGLFQEPLLREEEDKSVKEDQSVCK